MKKAMAGLAALVLTVAPAAGQANVTEVPLAVEGGRLVVPVDGPHGSELTFAISTGNAYTVLSETVATHLQGGELLLGGHPIPTDQVSTFPDDQLVSNGAAVDGLVAADFLSNYDVLIDAPAGRLLLRPVGRKADWEGVALGEPMRIRVYHGVAISMSAMVDGRETAATLELGTPLVIANPALQEAMGLEAEGTGSIGLAGRTFDGLPLEVRDMSIFERWDPNGNGFVLVGAPIAWECAIALSYVHAELRTCSR